MSCWETQVIGNPEKKRKKVKKMTTMKSCIMRSKIPKTKKPEEDEMLGINDLKVGDRVEEYSPTVVSTPPKYGKVRLIRDDLRGNKYVIVEFDNYSEERFWEENVRCCLRKI